MQKKILLHNWQVKLKTGCCFCQILAEEQKK